MVFGGNTFGYGSGQYSMFGAFGASAGERSLQQALVGLAGRTGDRSLAVATDGVVGPGTAAAVNRALVQYGAPSALRTGKLTVAQIKGNLAAVTRAIAAAGPVKKAGKVAVAPAKNTGTSATVKADILRLQNALRAVGQNIKADGALGPATTNAVNSVLKTKLTVANVAAQAAQLAARVEALASAQRQTQQKKTAAASAAAAAPAVSTAASMALQSALRALGPLVKDNALVIKADGIIGQGTAAAVNRAFSRYVSGAPAALKTGKLSVAEIKMGVSSLTSALLTEIAKRKAVSPAKSAAVPSGPVSGKPTKANVQRLQNAVRTLGQMVSDSALTAVAADGIIGPKTSAAINRALVQYVDGAPSQLRSGKLTIATVVSNLGPITEAVEGAIAGMQSSKAETARVAQEAAPTPSAPRVDEVPASPVPGGSEGFSPGPVPAGPSFSPAPAASAPSFTPSAAAASDDGAASSAPVPATYIPPASSSGGGGGGSGGGSGGGAGDLAPTAADATPAAPADDAAAATPATTGSEKKPFPLKAVLLVGGGVAVVGIAAYFLFSGGKGRRKRSRRRVRPVAAAG